MAYKPLMHKQIHRLFQNNQPSKKQLHEIKMAAIRLGEIPARGVSLYATKGYGNCWAIEASYPDTPHNSRHYYVF